MVVFGYFSGVDLRGRGCVVEGKFSALVLKCVNLFFLSWLGIVFLDFIVESVIEFVSHIVS